MHAARINRLVEGRKDMAVARPYLLIEGRMHHCGLVFAQHVSASRRGRVPRAWRCCSIVLRFERSRVFEWRHAGVAGSGRGSMEQN